MKPKINYLAVYSQFNNLKLSNNKLFSVFITGSDIIKTWLIFKNTLCHDCMTYHECMNCPYRTTKRTCILSRLQYIMGS